MSTIELLTKEERSFIREHITDSPAELNLKFHKRIPNLVFLIQQIKGRQIIKQKIPTWYDLEALILPPTLNLEQSSSEATATFKATIISQSSTFVDLTGGLGVDSFFISKKVDQCTYIEYNTELFKIAAYNLNLFCKNITTINESCITFLERTNEQFDWCFIDPARRDPNQKKVFLLEDCTPNIIDLKKRIHSISKRCMVKLSPLIDITHCIHALQSITQIYILSVHNEVKELLLILQKDIQKPIAIHAIDLNKEGNPISSFTSTFETVYNVQFEEPKTYLYEPNRVILKSGQQDKLCSDFGVGKLHANSNLYTSDALIEDFPGRIFHINELKTRLDKPFLKRIKKRKFNVLTRNYPIKAPALERKLQSIPGGNYYIIGTSSIKHPALLIICERITLSKA